MVASVKVVDSASGSQIKQVEAAMRIVGLNIEAVRARHPTQDRPHVGEALPWIISITLAAPVAAFFAAIGSEAGKDAYLALKEWLRGIAAISHPAVYGHVESKTVKAQSSTCVRRPCPMRHSPACLSSTGRS